MTPIEPVLEATKQQCGTDDVRLPRHQAELISLAKVPGCGPHRAIPISSGAQISTTDKSPIVHGESHSKDTFIKGNILHKDTTDHSQVTKVTGTIIQQQDSSNRVSGDLPPWNRSCSPGPPSFRGKTSTFTDCSSTLNNSPDVSPPAMGPPVSADSDACEDVICTDKDIPRTHKDVLDTHNHIRSTSTIIFDTEEDVARANKDVLHSDEHVPATDNSNRGDVISSTNMCVTNNYISNTCVSNTEVDPSDASRHVLDTRRDISSARDNDLPANKDVHASYDIEALGTIEQLRKKPAVVYCPHCSRYAVTVVSREAIVATGTWRRLGLAMVRLCGCIPRVSKLGEDHVHNCSRCHSILARVTHQGQVKLEVDAFEMNSIVAERWA